MSPSYAPVREIRQEKALRHVIVCHIKTYLPLLLGLIFTLFVEKRNGHRVKIEADDSTMTFEILMANPLIQFQPVSLSLDDMAVLLYTGGITSVSKAAMLTHRNILVNAW